MTGLAPQIRFTILALYKSLCTVCIYVHGCSRCHSVERYGNCAA